MAQRGRRKKPAGAVPPVGDPELYVKLQALAAEYRQRAELMRPTRRTDARIATALERIVQTAKTNPGALPSAVRSPKKEWIIAPTNRSLKEWIIAVVVDTHIKLPKEAWSAPLHRSALRRIEEAIHHVLMHAVDLPKASGAGDHPSIGVVLGELWSDDVEAYQGRDLRRWALRVANAVLRAYGIDRADAII